MVNMSVTFWTSTKRSPHRLPPWFCISTEAVSVRGSKDTVNRETLKQLLDAGISVAAIHYRLAGEVPLPAAHEDAQRAIQTLRSKADKWNVDKTQVGAFGRSSGAPVVHVAAYRDDQADPKSSDPIAANPRA